MIRVPFRVAVIVLTLGFSVPSSGLADLNQCHAILFPVNGAATPSRRTHVEGFNFKMKSSKKNIKEWMNSGNKIENYINSKGEIILFRYIRGEYKPGFKGYYTETENGLSYSAVSFGSLFTGGANTVKAEGEEYAIIALQNIQTDHIYWRMSENGIESPNVNSDATRVVRQNLFPIPNSANTEVKVPVDEENPLVIVPYRDFRSAYADLPEDATEGDFVNALLALPNSNLSYQIDKLAH